MNKAEDIAEEIDTIDKIKENAKSQQVIIKSETPMDMPDGDIFWWKEYASKDVYVFDVDELDNLMQAYTNATLQELKENFAEKLPHEITKVIYSETELNNEESHELAQKILQLIDGAINE